MGAAQRDAPQHVVHPEVAAVGELARDLAGSRPAAARTLRSRPASSSRLGCPSSCRSRLSSSPPPSGPGASDAAPTSMRQPLLVDVDHRVVPHHRLDPARAAARAAGRVPRTSAATGSAMPAWASGVDAATARCRRACRARASRSGRPSRAPGRRPAWPARGRRARSAPSVRRTARANSTECRSSSTSDAASLEAAPSTPRPTGTPASRRSRVRQMPAPSRALDDGQWATPVPRRGQRGDGGVVEVDAVGEPDVGAEPAERLDVLDGAAAELLAAERRPRRRSRRGACAAALPCRGRVRRLCSSRSPVTENGEQGATPTRSIESGEASWCRSIASAVAARICVEVLDDVVGRQAALAVRRGPSTRGSAGSAARPRGPPRSRRRAGRRRPRGRRSGGRSSSCNPVRASCTSAPVAADAYDVLVEARPTPGRAWSATRRACGRRPSPRVSHW